MKELEPHVDFDWDAVAPDLEAIQATHREVYRVCARMFLRALHHAIAMQPDSVAKWAVMFATSDPACQGRSMADVASEIGVSRAAISGMARKFCTHTGIPPSSYMRSEEAARLASKIRTANKQKEKRK